MASLPFTRRRLLEGGAVLGLSAATGTRAGAAGPLSVGFIYVGPKDDYGYNQANAVDKTMESMINLDGVSLLFPTSFGYYNPYLLAAAKKHPKVSSVTAAACGPTRTPKTRARISATSRRAST